MVSGVRRGPGRGLLDRRDRRPAADGRGQPRDPRLRPCAARRRRTRRSPRRSGPPTPFDKQRVRRGRAALGHRDASPRRQGRGDDLARTSRRCCASCRPTRALSRADLRRCCSACASSARSSGSRVDGQLSTNDTVILQASRRVRCGRRARDRGRAAASARRSTRVMRQLALRCRRATARAPAGSGGSSCAAATRSGVARVARAVADSPAGQDRAVRRRPELGADHPGRRQRPCRDTAPLPRRHRDRGRAGVLGRRRASPTTRRRSPPPSPRDEVEYEIGAARATAPRPRCYFSDLGHEYVTINAEYTT